MRGCSPFLSSLHARVFSRSFGLPLLATDLPSSFFLPSSTAPINPLSPTKSPTDAFKVTPPTKNEEELPPGEPIQVAALHLKQVGTTKKKEEQTGKIAD
jgi:hypothetical protein